MGLNGVILGTAFSPTVAGLRLPKDCAGQARLDYMGENLICIW